jgi:hypothetical protein
MKELPAFQHVNWQPDRLELRRFAIAMLVGFAILGAVSSWRAHGVGPVAVALWTVGVILALASQVPGLGRVAYLAVYLPSSLMGFAISQVLLTVLFFGVFTPLGLILRLTGKDPLYLRPGEQLRWFPHQGRTDRRSYYRQF